MLICPQVPNLFPKDEMVVIMELVTQRAKRAGKQLTPQVGAQPTHIGILPGSLLAIPPPQTPDKSEQTCMSCSPLLRKHWLLRY